VIAGRAADLPGGAAMAADSIDTGRARAAAATLADITRGAPK
jgi:anthranilate phosphoribosyltransferase